MIVVVGDVMQDILYDCVQERMCPEDMTAPVLRIVEKNTFYGGAANVASNIWRLGAACKPIGDRIAKQTIKQRFMIDNKLMFRVDDEAWIPSPLEEKGIISQINNLLSPVSVFIISDYAKGVVTDKVVETVFYQAAQNNAFVIVDSKHLDRVCFQQGDHEKTIFKPNMKEITRITGTWNDLAAISALLNKLQGGKVLLTCGDKGMFLADGMDITYIGAHRVKAIDVTGAGDTVAAAFAVALQRGASYEVAAHFANAAAAIAVTKKGTYAPTLEEVSTLYVHSDITNSGDRS